MTRKALILTAALTLSACATVTASDLQQIADGIMTGVRTAKFAYCSSPPKAQERVLSIIRKAFPAAVITCQSAAGGEPVVVLGERRT